MQLKTRLNLLTTMKHNETVLITGGAGFIGSNFIVYLLEQNKNIHIINLDKLTYAGELSNLIEIENSERYTFIKGDICDRTLIESLFNKYEFKGVIHFAFKLILVKQRFD